jgi:hypothetical protein
MAVFMRAEFLHQPGLANLPRALQQKRSAIRRIFPAEKRLIGGTFHGFPLNLDDNTISPVFQGKNVDAHTFFMGKM